MAENNSAESTETSHARPNFHGKYSFVRNEKFEEFLAANGRPTHNSIFNFS